MAGEVNIVAIVKDEERYVFMFDDDSRAETLRTLGRYASDPELSFTWYDAAVLSQKVRATRKAEVAEVESVSIERGGIPDVASDLGPISDFDFNPDDIWIGDDPVN